MKSISRDIEAVGYAVMENVYSQSMMSEVAQLVNRMYLDTDETMIFGMLNFGEVFWDIAAHANVLSTVSYFLGKELRIGACMCKLLKPGAKQLRIHTDGTEPFYRKLPNIPFMINTMTCLTDFTDMNGAFRVIPFSHKSPLLKPEVLRLFNHTDISTPMINSKPVCAPRGSVILWDSRLWHGHGPNISKQAQRLSVNVSYYPSWFNIRIELNHEPVHPEVFKRMPPELQSLVRYKVGKTRLDVYER